MRQTQREEQEQERLQRKREANIQQRQQMKEEQEMERLKRSCKRDKELRAAIAEEKQRPVVLRLSKEERQYLHHERCQAVKLNVKRRAMERKLMFFHDLESQVYNESMTRWELLCESKAAEQEAAAVEAEQERQADQLRRQRASAQRQVTAHKSIIGALDDDVRGRQATREMNEAAESLAALQLRQLLDLPPQGMDCDIPNDIPCKRRDRLVPVADGMATRAASNAGKPLDSAPAYSFAPRFPPLHRFPPIAASDVYIEIGSSEKFVRMTKTE